MRSGILAAPTLGALLALVACDTSYWVDRSNLERLSAGKDRPLVPAERSDGSAVLLRAEKLDPQKALSAAGPASGRVKIVPRSRALTAAAWLAGAGGVTLLAGALTFTGMICSGDDVCFLAPLVAGSVVTGVGFALLAGSGISALVGYRAAEAKPRPSEP